MQRLVATASLLGLLLAGCQCGSRDPVDPEFEAAAAAAAARRASSGGPPVPHPSGANIPLGLTVDLPDVGPRSELAPDPFSASTSTAGQAAEAGATTIKDMFSGKPRPAPDASTWILNY